MGAWIHLTFCCKVKVKTCTSENFFCFSFLAKGLSSQMVKNLPAMQETQVQALGWEDPLEKGMATHSSIPGWRIPWTEEPGGLQFNGVTKSRIRLSDWFFNFQFFLAEQK